MKKIVLAGALLTATLAPAFVPAAQAQDQRIREDQRALRQDRRDLREDRREAWQTWRESHRDAYRRGGWRAPFAYRRFDIGVALPRDYWGPRYYVNNWGDYRLPAPNYGYYRYIRHYDDLLLINTRNGRVVRVYRDFYW